MSLIFVYSRHESRTRHKNLSVRFLVSGTGSRSTKFLGLAATRISNQKAAVKVDKDVLDLLFGGFINICRMKMLIIFTSFSQSFMKKLTFLVVGDQGFGDSLSDSIHLSNMTTTLNFNSDVNSSETVLCKTVQSYIPIYCSEYYRFRGKVSLKLISYYFVFGIILSSFKKSKNGQQVGLYLAQQEDGFVEFVLEETGFNDGQWPAIHFNEPMAAFAISNSSGRFLYE